MENKSNGQITIRADDFTVGEMETFEDEVGERFSESLLNPSAKALKVLIWLVKKRQEPDFTLEQAAEVKPLVALAAPEEEPKKKRPLKRSRATREPEPSQPSATSGE